MSGTQRMEPGGTPLNSVAISGDDADYGVYFPVDGAALDAGLNSGVVFPVFFDTGTTGVSDLFIVAPDPDMFLVSHDPDVFLVAPGRTR